MAMKANQWSPDTCGCILEYEWDDSLPAASRVHTIKSVIKACAVHDSFAGNQSGHYQSVLRENQSKNKVYGQLIAIPEISEEFTIDSSGNIGRRLKSGIRFLWSFSGSGDSRILSISISGVNLTSGQKSALQAWCDLSLGNGRAVVV